MATRPTKPSWWRRGGMLLGSGMLLAAGCCALLSFLTACKCVTIK